MMAAGQYVQVWWLHNSETLCCHRIIDGFLGGCRNVQQTDPTPPWSSLSCGSACACLRHRAVAAAGASCNHDVKAAASDVLQ